MSEVDFSAAMVWLEVPLWCWLLLVAFLLIYWHGTSTYGIFKRLGIPYETPTIPYLGNIAIAFTKPFPEDDLELVKRFPGKIIGRFIGRTPVLMVGDASIYKQIMVQQFSKFRNRRSPLAGEQNIFTGNIVGTADDHWKHVRSTLVPTFTSGRLKQMFPVIKNCGDKLVAHIKAADGAPVVIKDYTSAYTMDVIASTAFGLEIDAHAGHPFVKHSNILMGVHKFTNLRDRIHFFLAILIVFICPRFLRLWISQYLGIGYSNLTAKSVRYFEEIVNKIVEDQSEDASSQEKNFISMSSRKVVDMTSVKDSEIKQSEVTGFIWTTAGLTKEDFLANAILFIIAGHETTATALQFSLYLLAINPDVQQQLFEEIQESVGEEATYEKVMKMQFLDWCVSEILRLYPPGLRFDRVASEDVTIDGVVIPKDMQVFGCLYGMNHDPDVWPDAEKFDPLRFAPENLTEMQSNCRISFGAGARTCIAMRLALLEVKLAIVQLVRTFRFERCGETTPPEKLKFIPSINFLQTDVPLKIAAVPR